MEDEKMQTCQLWEFAIEEKLKVIIQIYASRSLRKEKKDGKLLNIWDT